MTAVDQLPANMRSKIALEPAPVDTVVGPCWTWQNCTNSSGYGCVAVAGKAQLVHRVAYRQLVGEIPAGLQIDHLCTNKLCCNPGHLEPVTARVNMSRTAKATKTRCIHGHELSGQNLIIKRRPGGSTLRNCRACQREAQRRCYQASKARVA